MTRAFLIQPESFHFPLVRELAARGIDIVLASITEQDDLYNRGQRELPGVQVISAFRMHGGIAPPEVKIAYPPATAEDARLLDDWEGAALQMVDRLNYDGRSVSELRSVLLRYVSVWRALLDHFRPDIVLFQGTPHMGNDFVLYQLCQAAGIRTLIFERTYLNERLFIKEHLADSVGPTAEEIAARQAELEPAPVAAEDKPLRSAHHEKLNRQFNDLAAIRRGLSWFGLVRTVIGSVRQGGQFRPIASTVHGLSQRQPSQIRYRWEELRNHRDARRCLEFYLKHSRDPQLDTNFVFYPMHFEPERTTVPDGLRASDQLFVIRSLAEALPADWSLYVKEHPRQFRRGALWPKARSLDYYRQLQAIPRVTLVPLDFPSSPLVERCQATSTITGTAGWEALLVGKPALVWGNAWYIRCPGVRLIRDYVTCREVLSTVSRGECLIDHAAVRAYAELMTEQYTFHGCFSDRLQRMSKLPCEENIRNYVEAILAKVSQKHNQTRRESREVVA